MLPAGDGRYVFFTSAQGRILAEARIMALAESLLLELPAGARRLGQVDQAVQRAAGVDFEGEGAAVGHRRGF